MRLDFVRRILRPKVHNVLFFFPILNTGLVKNKLYKNLSRSYANFHRIFTNLSIEIRNCHNSKIVTPQLCIVIVHKIEHFGFTAMHPEEADEIANSIDPDQTAPFGAV